MNIAPRSYTQALDWTNHIIESHEESSPLELVNKLHMKYPDLLTKYPKIKVLKMAPTNPSTVFLGDNASKGVRPVVTPERL